MQQFAGLGFVKVVTVKPYSDFYVMGWRKRSRVLTNSFLTFATKLNIDFS